MFALIQRGQIYTDSAGYPIKILRCINNEPPRVSWRVFYL
nr:DUF4222 domain-containing protein [Escherichia coli]